MSLEVHPAGTELAPPAAKVPVYVFALSATVACDTAPPSDHETKEYVMPPRTCGVATAMVLCDPATTVADAGVVSVLAPTTTRSPLGAVAKERMTASGSSLRSVTPVKPPPSRAASRSVRNDGYSWSGAMNEPVATPAKSCIGCW